ncbi:phosphate regulon transcriptional regulator PhoB [Cocleimonas flava]|uniref:Phosphate regulon transcriptional regulatory protein PhoB n=1 Tax=Cocleimonas flava TaxID=634765 RepID=A0A4R1F7K2_9GAMM|nr:MULTISPECIES: phosphate regulon transcriptional regulator PhoB [Cocleimonas]MEB8430903.1 phosphate regulon transcriptional regulator PhoB [Cocleimonas sp. KMM 6892]MEC4714325.1 phosphate regulon transcriptional regulator PhoB [Cocleimonas sp. KMM 6895]MEC4743656.1 phosphate regulon transcriptional regulator PhoB [Cocleimonas sp. KMM 6896]TCJ88599.1 winged helix family two component transcriptional regulator [Cocleimonas flava]
MNTILLVEDEKPIRSMLDFALKKAGFQTLEAEDASQTRLLLKNNDPDLILMDWMLPDASGVDIVRSLKGQVSTCQIPIIMLTAKSEEANKVSGLNAGADDYVTKPFSPKELIARIQAVLRRSNQEAEEQDVIRVGQLEIDRLSHRVSLVGEALDLGPTEYRLLLFLIEHPDRVFSRENLLNQVWSRSPYVEERTVDVHILRLRRALAIEGYDNAIQTVRGIGYRFHCDKR